MKKISIELPIVYLSHGRKVIGMAKEKFNEVRELIGEEFIIVEVDGQEFKVKMNSPRLMTYRPESLGGQIDCQACNIKGNVFQLEVNKDQPEFPHFNIYNSKEVEGKLPKLTLLTSDHIQPRSLGGIDDIENRQCLCGSCNQRKGSNVINVIDNKKIHTISLQKNPETLEERIGRYIESMTQWFFEFAPKQTKKIKNVPKDLALNGLKVLPSKKSLESKTRLSEMEKLGLIDIHNGEYFLTEFSEELIRESIREIENRKLLKMEKRKERRDNDGEEKELPEWI